MEAKFLKDPDNKCDYVLVSADEQSFTYLNQGNPLRVGFYIDNNENLPFYKRKAIVVIIGKDLDFERHKVYKEGIFRKGLIDKTYLIHYMAQMKKKLVKMAMDEYDIFDKELKLEDHSQKNIKAPKQKDPPELMEVESEIIEESREYSNAAEAAEMLKVSCCTIANLAKRGIIKGENNGNGWYFIKSDLALLLQEKPEFLVKIWSSSKSITKREPYSKEIIEGNEIFIHIRKAQKVVNLSRATITLYAKQGLIRHKKERGKDYYISLRHAEELKANPPDWLKKSWSYFNNGKEK